jgi:hypothetical protein
MASSGFMGLMVTTSGVEKAPAGSQARLVIYMETFFLSSMFLMEMPAAKRAFSKEKLQPNKKLTMPS